MPVLTIAADGSVEVDIGSRWRAYHPDGTLAGAQDRGLSLPFILANGVELETGRVVIGERVVELAEPVRRAVVHGDAVWVGTSGALMRVDPTRTVTILVPGLGGFAVFDGGLAWTDQGGLHVRHGRRTCTVPGLEPLQVTADATGDRVAWNGGDRLLVVDGACRPIAAAPLRTEALGFGVDRWVRWTLEGPVVHDPVTLAARTPEVGGEDLAVRADGDRMVLVAGGRAWDPASGLTRAAPTAPPAADGRALSAPTASIVLRPVPGGVRVTRDGRALGAVLPAFPDSAAVSPDARLVATLEGARLTLWETATGRARWTVDQPDARAVLGVDRHLVVLRADGLRLLRATDAGLHATARQQSPAASTLVLTLLRPDAPAWDSRSPRDHPLPDPPAVDAPEPAAAGDALDALGLALHRELQAILGGDLDCGRADALRARWDALPELDAAVVAAVAAACPPRRLLPGPPWPAPVPGVAPTGPPLGPPGSTVPAAVPLRTDVPTLLVRPDPSALPALRALAAAGVPVYTVAGASSPREEDPFAGGPGSIQLSEPPALPGLDAVLDGLGVPAALVDGEGRVLATGELGATIAGAWLAWAEPRGPLPSAWMAPSAIVTLPARPREVIDLGGDALVRTATEVARVGPDLLPRWRLPVEARSAVVDGDRAWVDAGPEGTFPVSLADGSRGPPAGRGRYLPGPTPRFWVQAGVVGRVVDDQQRPVTPVALTPAAEPVGDHLEVQVGPWRAEVGLDGTFRRFLPVGDPALTQARAGAVSHRRGREVLARATPGSLRPFGDGRWIVQAGGPGGPWLVLDDAGRARAALEATRLTPVGDSLWGATGAGLARWEGPW